MLLLTVLLPSVPRGVGAFDRLSPEAAAPPLDTASRLEPRAVLSLTSPPSPMVCIAEADILMGSEESDVLEALADCAREPYGHRCTPTLFANELPRHRVHLSSFWIDRFEVRVSDYERCVQVGRCGPRPVSEGTRRFDRPDHPVSRVTWDDARDYCAFRRARLPTEAEFERAARGLTGRRYPWGELWNSWAGNHGRFGWDVTDASDGFAELAPVGSFAAGATPEGIYDLGGNVAEWTADRYALAYDPEPAHDPRGPSASTTNLRVVRGGSYSHARFRLRGAARAFAEPGERRTTLGFRCVRSARRAPGGEPAPP
ncbi:MAG: SUMF1/EgtB/PvdO family nonheme iron enzyme [Deltaproteobacteria bacterium]